jgi:imidazolonepropionase-like amidohydrolase
MRSVTLTPAEILGVSERVGSLEVGKDATLIVTDGDPLEVRTNTEMAFIQGKTLDMNSKHTALYKKYLEKYRQLGLIRRQ